MLVLTVLLGLSACGGGKGAGNGSAGGNSAPQAALTAGPAKTGVAVQLDASGSLGPNPLTFEWSLLSKPVNSRTTLANGAAATAHLFLDVNGDYQVQVKVTDATGQVSSKTLQLQAQADTNLAPVIRAFSAPQTPAPLGEATRFHWDAVDPNGSSFTCLFNPTGSGPQIPLPDCATTPTTVYRYEKAGVYQPELTVVDAQGLSTTAALAGVTLVGDLAVDIQSPVQGAQMPDALLPIAAKVTSGLEVSSVTARIAGRSVPLVFSEAALCNKGHCVGGMAGQLNVAGLPAGDYVLEVRVQDTQGHTALAHRALHYGAATPPVAAGTGPVVGAFLTASAQVFAGSPVAFYGVVSHLTGLAVSCKLDATGRGDWVFIPKCSGPVVAGFVYPAEGQYQPTLVATDALGQTATAQLALSVSADPAVKLVSPSAGALVGARVAVSARVTASHEVTQVVARVGAQQALLTYSPTAVCARASCSPGFTGVLELASTPKGAQQLELVVTTQQNRSTRVVRDIIYDEAPSIGVASPANLALASPQIPLQASCSDDEPGCRLDVTLGTTLLASGVGAVSQLVNLAAYDGQQLALKFTATDSRQQQTTVTRSLFVETSSLLTPMLTLPGPIVDVDANRVLYVTPEDTGDQAWVQNLTTGTPTALGLPAGILVGRSFLSQTGAVLTLQDKGASVVSTRLVDWNGGTLYELGAANSAESLVVKGGWAIWSNAATLMRRNLLSLTHTAVSTQAGNWQNDVALDGRVVWWGNAAAGYHIFTHLESTAAITQGALWNSYVLTDGHLSVYRKHTPCCAGQTYAITLFDGSNEITLRPANTQEPSPGADYQVNAGWVAYTGFGNLGQKHLFTRSPQGEYTQWTSFGRDSTLEALAPTGAVMLVSNGRRYLGRPGQSLIEVGSALGKVYYTDTGWRIVLGRSLFAVGI